MKANEKELKAIAAKHDYACRMDALAEERAIEITQLKAQLTARAQEIEHWRSYMEQRCADHPDSEREWQCIACLEAQLTARAQEIEQVKAASHQPPHVHHCCEPSNLAGAPPFGVYCHHTRTWVDGAAQQDDYECPRCKTRITVNVSEWRVEKADAVLVSRAPQQEQQAIGQGIAALLTHELRPDEPTAEDYLNRAAAPLPALPAWQPIETAPMDRDVLLLVGNIDPSFAERVEIGRWVIGDPFAQRLSAKASMWRFRRSQSRNYDSTHQPTGWMPLPAAPLAAALSRADQP